MDLRFLKSLVNVVDEGSIAAAAQREGITASAISQRLQTLETELQVKLLLRSGRNVRPTPACIGLLPQIRRLLEEGRALTLLLAQTATVGRFRLGAISTALTDYIPRIIHHTSTQMPGVALSVHPGSSVQLYRALQDGELDAALCVAPPFELPKSMRFDVLVRHPVGLIQRAGIEKPIHHSLSTAGMPGAARPVGGRSSSTRQHRESCVNWTRWKQLQSWFRAGPALRWCRNGRG